MEHIEFTKAMKKTHTILVPMMLPIHFQFLENILRNDGYRIEILKTTGNQLIEEGLRNVHNDTCYPALLVIGQMIDALKSGKYDVNHVALAITQTGGGCRASNYIHLLRKALLQAGFPQVPVISVNFSNLEKNSGFCLTWKNLTHIASGFLYSDVLLWLSNQVKPYEVHANECDSLVRKWTSILCEQFHSLKFMQLSKNVSDIVEDFKSVKVTKEPKIRVGIVGEIYMKYAPLGNNELEAFLIKENCEPVVSGVMDFALYCLENAQMDYQLYGRGKRTAQISKWASIAIMKMQSKINNVIQRDGTFRAPATFDEVKACADGFIHRGAKMGEGWLLTSEMVELIHSGVNNIVCCQPFGCLPNHIVAKGMMRKIKNQYPMSNIVAIDYDPGATVVNQENRLKLMLSNARINETTIQDEGILTKAKTPVFAYDTK